jgi:hypothetical protein
MNASEMDLGMQLGNPEERRMRGNTNGASSAFPEEVPHPRHARGSRCRGRRAKLVTLVRQRLQKLSPKGSSPLWAHIGLPSLVRSLNLDVQRN